MKASKKGLGRISRKLHEVFLDCLFPINCLGCQKENHWLCSNCRQKIKTSTEQVCPKCEKNLTPDGKVCHHCRPDSPLDGLLVCASYQDRQLRQTIHNFKYRFVSDLAIPLGKILTEKIGSSSIPLPDLILPVPLHPRRERWRGFNQSHLLAKQVSQNLTPNFEISLDSKTLQRIRFTDSQMKIKNYQKRYLNLKNAFKIIDPEKIRQKRILLIDDIATTGATIFECAEVLREAGASEIFAVVLARQEINR